MWHYTYHIIVMLKIKQSSHFCLQNVGWISFLKKNIIHLHHLLSQFSINCLFIILLQAGNGSQPMPFTVLLVYVLLDLEITLVGDWTRTSDTARLEFRGHRQYLRSQTGLQKQRFLRSVLSPLPITTIHGSHFTSLFMASAAREKQANNSTDI